MARGDATQYGGTDGTPMRFPDGSDKGLTPREEARVLRQIGMEGDFDQTAPPLEDALTDQEARLLAEEDPRVAESRRVLDYRNKMREQLRIRTNDYAKGVTGESAS